jgi:hypothetical protein
MATLPSEFYVNRTLALHDEPRTVRKKTLNYPYLATGVQGTRTSRMMTSQASMATVAR